MIHLLIGINAILFTIAFAFRNKWQFLERNSEYYTGRLTELKEGNIKGNRPMTPKNTMRLQSIVANKKWHSWQAVVQSCFFSLIILIGAADITRKTAIFAALTYMAVYWVLFDGLLNKIAFNKPFFAVGTTATIDRFFQRFSKPGLVMAIVKIVLLLSFLTPYIIFSIK